MADDLEVHAHQQAMEESGELDFIRQVVAENAGHEPPAAQEDAEPAESDTVEEEVVEEVQEEEPAAEAEEAAEELDDVLYLDLDEETQSLIDQKYGGDLNEFIRAAREAQSIIGRQGNEMGAQRTELEAYKEELRQLRAQLIEDFAALQPYPEFPDEYAEPSEVAATLRQIAEQAFDRRDPQMFQRALTQWEEADPVSAGLYRDLKEMQVQQLQSQAPAAAHEAAPEDTFDSMVQNVRSEFPQFQEESFQKEVAAELEKTPSLKAVLWGQVPGVSVEERGTILREAAQRVLARTTSETAQQARRRIAVRTSEEARQARVEAQVARGSSARDTEPEVQPRTIPMGDSGRVLNIDRLNAMLDPEDRI